VAPRKKPTITLPPHVRCVRSRGREYFYFHVARGTKAEQKAVRLPDDPRLPEWWEAYRRLIDEPEQRPRRRSFDRCVEEYRGSPEFKGLSTSTRRDYDRYLSIIRSTWGGLEVAGLMPAHVLKLRDKHQRTPAAANGLIRSLSALISWSVPRGYRTDNPCEHVRKLAIGDGWEAWPWEMIQLLERHGPPWMWQAAALALYTGQRQADVLGMTRAKVRNGLIEVKQEKTGRELVIPAHQKLLSVLAMMKHDSVQILTNTRGLPWTSNGFRASWNGVLEPPQQKQGTLPRPHPLWPIKQAGLVFHGLRKSSVVMLLEVGCTTAEVQAITGQSMQMVEHYAKQVSQKKLAAPALLKWERGENV
jgi:hypothetical protein